MIGVARPEGEDGFIYLFLSHASSRFCGGVKALAEALNPTRQVAAVPPPSVAVTLCDGGNFCEFQMFAHMVLCIIKITAALNETFCESFCKSFTSFFLL